MSFLLFEKVSKVYRNGVRALHEVSFEVQEGEMVFLIGPTGAGKTSLLKLVTLEERPTSGEIWLDGCCLNRLGDHRIPILRRNLGIVFQDQVVVSYRSVYENLIVPLEVLRLPRKVVYLLAKDILSSLGLWHKRQHLVSELSGGERQKLCIGRALIHRPRIVLADEPTKNLDSETSSFVLRMLYEYSLEHRATVLVATHTHRLARLVPDSRCVFIKEGQIVGVTRNHSSTKSKSPS
ncbi:MAG: cell division transport system ATP-binding protein [Candidatus Atribacteria bacterium]|uniref:cell division ATP-binding protein FtsE n=1 Tax=Atrimonas thermophila TaxID=3064161 RepID=UPI0024AB82BC|nr:cell division transport system ATP-binding protein [Candidatus Atribacteria bacterium]